MNRNQATLLRHRYSCFDLFNFFTRYSSLVVYVVDQKRSGLNTALQLQSEGQLAELAGQWSTIMLSSKN